MICGRRLYYSDRYCILPKGHNVDCEDNLGKTYGKYVEEYQTERKRQVDEAEQRLNERLKGGSNPVKVSENKLLKPTLLGKIWRVFK